MKFAYMYDYKHHEPNFDTIKFVMISFYVLGILTSIKKENDEKSEEGTDITMSFPSGHDSDGLHYRVQGTFTRWDIILIHKFPVACYISYIIRIKKFKCFKIPYTDFASFPINELME